MNRAAFLFIASGVAGCSGGGDTGTDPTPDPAPITNPSFATDIQGTFNTKGCTASNCHDASSQANGNLSLRTGTSYGLLVGVMGDQENIVRVIAGNADGSYLIIKLEGRQSRGSRMPKGEPALSANTIQTIKNWINNGASNN